MSLSIINNSRKAHELAGDNRKNRSIMENEERNPGNNGNPILAKLVCSIILFFCTIIILQVAAIKLAGGFLRAKEAWNFSENYSRQEAVPLLIIGENIFLGVLAACLIGSIGAGLCLSAFLLTWRLVPGARGTFCGICGRDRYFIRPPTAPL